MKGEAKAERPGRGWVLLAEDNYVNQRVAQRLLEKQGLIVDVVPNGREALAAYRRHPYDAIFMDCQMPEMDGYQTTAEIRLSEGDGRHVPIIAMTANAMSGDREQCLSAGMDDYVSKPISAEVLRTVIRRHIRGCSEGAAQDHAVRG